MKIKITKILGVIAIIAVSVSSLTAAPRSGVRVSGRPAEPSRFSPRPAPHHFSPPPPAPRPHGFEPRPHIGGEWVAVGGLAYLAGTIVRACTDTPDVVYVDSTPQTVVVSTPQRVVVQRQSVVVNQVVVSPEVLRVELQQELVANMQNFPFSIAINSLSTADGCISANVTALVTIWGTTYNVTTGASRSNYQALKTYLKSEILNAVSNIQVPSTTVTVVN